MTSGLYESLYDSAAQSPDNQACPIHETAFFVKVSQQDDRGANFEQEVISGMPAGFSMFRFSSGTVLYIVSAADGSTESQLSCSWACM